MKNLLALVGLSALAWWVYRNYGPGAGQQSLVNPAATKSGNNPANLGSNNVY